MKKIGWILFGFFSIGIGLYPSLYGLVDMSQGFLGWKSAELLNDKIWNWLFYQHISFGAISLLTGWTQFSSKLRRRNINWHRILGKTYVIAALLSGIAGLYLSFYATGGWISSLGFGALATLWLITTIAAFNTIRQGKVDAHQNWMIRSYALCWAAVTLRLWSPLLSGGFGMDGLSAYLLVAWLCWVPNLIVAEWFIGRNTLAHS